MNKLENWRHNDLGLSLRRAGLFFNRILVSFLRMSLGHKSNLEMSKAIVSNPITFFKKAYTTYSDLWDKIYHNLTQLPSVLTNLYEGLKTELGTDFSGNISHMVSYYVGQLAFEILLSALTLGAGAAFKATKIGSKLIPKMVEFSSDLVSGLKSAIPKMKKSNEFLYCRILKLRCFVKDTPVLMAGNNPFKVPAVAYAMAALPLVSPIQDVKPDDIVKAYHHEQSYYATADVNDRLNMPGWQSYDYQHITPETWQIGTFEIREANGDIVNVEANRPHTWYNENNVNAIGDKAHFYMPEIGINGDATLLSIRPTTINTTNLGLNEQGQVDRPVITTFKRNAPIVYDYHFSDGAVIGATPEHPFFSVDRNAYIAVGEIQLGEQVMTAGEKVVKFIAGKQRDKGEPVYNFEVWREHNYYVGSRESGEFMLVHNSCDLFDHIFKGKIEIVGGVPGAYKFKITGVHSNKALDGVKARIKDGTKSTPNAKGYYKAKVEMHHPDNPNNGGWKVKDEESTFFPDDWDQDKVTEEIAHGLSNKQKKQTMVRTRSDGSSYTVDRYEGYTSDGTKLQIYIEKGKDIPDTVFPDIN